MKPKYFALAVLVCLTAFSCKSNTESSAPKPVPSIVTFSASPDTIEQGQSTTLRWSISGAASASIDQGIGSIAADGQKDVSPMDTVTYTLTASNANGSTNKTVTVTVKKVAKLELDTYAYATKSYGSPYVYGLVKNNGQATAYNAKIEFRAYSDPNRTTIIDNASGFPGDLSDVGPGQRAAFEAVFFNLTSWSQVKSMDYRITWLNRTYSGRMEPMVVQEGLPLR